MYSLIRQLLFLLPPETAHRVALNGLTIDRLFLRAARYSPPQINPKRVLGLDFPNPVGLAAGLDKNGNYIDALGCLGFGFIEVGTVTPRPQGGNEKPRLFRLRKAEALINRMGFNNKGVDYLVRQLDKHQYQGVLGVNIGKNFDTPLDQAIGDYIIGLQRVYTRADYITVNISSPNTPGLRKLQHGKMLSELITSIQYEQQDLGNRYGYHVPVLYKVAPDLTEGEIKKMASVFNRLSVEGLIASNTTSSRTGVEKMKYANEEGGLSGRPVFEASTAVLKQFREKLDRSIPIIGVGGISSVANANEKLAVGADLIQVYTGLIYQGPKFIQQLIEQLELGQKPDQKR